MEQRRWPREDIDFGDGPILVRVATIEHLFNPMDPAPMEERALNEEVVDWIEEWAEDIDAGEPLDVEIHVASAGSEGREAAVAAAIQHHFEYRQWQLARALHKLLRQGRISLVIGLFALAGFNAASRLIGSSTNPIVELIHEGLAVLGWVSMWRPLEILLYDWWPIRRERRTCQRIADATISFPTAAVRPR
jgi:hypothetical protein